MRTDQLVALLVADLRPVDPRRVLRAVIIALATGLAAALVATMLIFALPPELLDGNNLEFLSIKLLFASGIVATAAAFLPQLARPGAPMCGSFAFALMPFVLIVVAATAELVWTNSSAWPGMLIEQDSLTCLPSIPLLAILPFISLIWALRMGAPTDRVRAAPLLGLPLVGSPPLPALSLALNSRFHPSRFGMDSRSASVLPSGQSSVRACCDGKHRRRGGLGKRDVSQRMELDFATAMA